MKPSPTTPDGKPSKPLWRKHFPIESDADASQSRRGFIGGVAIAGGTIACCQAALQPSTPEQPSEKSDVADVWTEHEPHTLEANFNDMQVGEATQFHFPDHRSPCLLVKLDADDFVAYSQKCTHLACPVIPEFEENRFHCPCHHGAFDLRTGEPTAGPPQRPLPSIRVEKKSDGTLIASATK